MDHYLLTCCLVLGACQDGDDGAKNKIVKKWKEEEKKERDMIIFQEMITIPKQEEIDELVEGKRFFNQ